MLMALFQNKNFLSSNKATRMCGHAGKNVQLQARPRGLIGVRREINLLLHPIVIRRLTTYTLETIVQAGREKIALTSVPIHTNAELRPSRLFNSILGYVKKSMLTILRAYMMYKPLKCFTYVAIPPVAVGVVIGCRFLYYAATGRGGGHVQSLILACTLIIIGFLTFVIGLLADVIAANRKILQDTQYHTRKREYDS